MGSIIRVEDYDEEATYPEKNGPKSSDSEDEGDEGQGAVHETSPQGFCGFDSFWCPIGPERRPGCKNLHEDVKVQAQQPTPVSKAGGHVPVVLTAGRVGQLPTVVIPGAPTLLTHRFIPNLASAQPQRAEKIKEQEPDPKTLKAASAASERPEASSAGEASAREAKRKMEEALEKAEAEAREEQGRKEVALEFEAALEKVQAEAREEKKRREEAARQAKKKAEEQSRSRGPISSAVFKRAARYDLEEARSTFMRAVDAAKAAKATGSQDPVKVHLAEMKVHESIENLKEQLRQFDMWSWE